MKNDAAINVPATDDTAHLVEILTRVPSRHPMNPNLDLWDAGLVIAEHGEPDPGEVFAPYLSDENVIYTEVTETAHSGTAVESILDANETGKWCVVTLRTDPGQEFLQTLKGLTESNYFSLQHTKGEELYTAALNPDTRVIVLCSRETLETRVSYPNFQALFGPVVRLT